MAIKDVLQGDKKLNMKDLVVGHDKKVPLLNGQMVRYTYLDNAASTPSLVVVAEAVNRFLPYYSSVHRGNGFKSRLSTVAYDQAHEIVAAFVGADLETNTVIFGKNTTEAINKLSYRLPRSKGQLVLTTQMEHHSNDLPWRRRGRVVHVKTGPDGRVDDDDLEMKLNKHRGNIALLAVSGASNVSGFVQPVHEYARMAHDAGALILVDAAQLAPHRLVDVKDDDDPAHLDFVALSAHKMYAPFGTGALIGPKSIFLSDPPEYTGGGTVDIVTMDEVHWAGMPDRDEAGSPNVVGAVAMAAAAKALMEIGMDRIAAHEEELVIYALNRLSRVPKIELYGSTDPSEASGRVGVIPFSIKGLSHFLVAAILGYEGGVGVRSGCFCAHPYVVDLLDLDEKSAKTWRQRVLSGDRSQMPGLIRASFGCYNDESDIDVLTEMLERIVAGDYEGDYQLVRETGEYYPIGYAENFKEYFEL